jgi:hypothetical protein
LEAFLVEAGMTTDVTALHREHIETFIVHLTETRSASTAATRYRGLDAGRARHRAGLDWPSTSPRAAVDQSLSCQRVGCRGALRIRR